MPDVKRTVKIVTEQNVKPGEDSGMEGFPLRHWSIRLFLLMQGDANKELDADIFDKVTYKLHPSFEEKATQTFRKPPFKIEEDGWGEFEIEIILTDASGKEHLLGHDLNFQSTRYETKHAIVFKNPKQPLLQLLRNSGPIPGEAAAGASGDVNGTGGKKKGGDDGKKIKKRPDVKGIDMDKLADGLQKLGEDDLLQVVQMVHDNKSEDSWTRNDVDQGEFHVDLYTLPDNLIKMLWDFTSDRVAVS